MDEVSFKTTTIMEIFHLLLKYIYHPELDTKIEDIYDLLEKLPDNDKLTDYLFIIVRYILASGAITEKRLREHTKRFAGGDKMLGVAAQEIEERVERTKKPYWEQKAKIEITQNHIIEALTAKFGDRGHHLSKKIESIQSLDILNILFKNAMRVDSVEEFDQLVNKVLN